MKRRGHKGHKRLQKAQESSGTRCDCAQAKQGERNAHEESARTFEIIGLVHGSHSGGKGNDWY